MLYLALVLRDTGLRLETAPLMLSKDPRRVWQRMLEISPLEKGFDTPGSGLFLFRGYPDHEATLQELFAAPDGNPFRIPGLISSLCLEGGEWRVTWYDPVAQRRLTSSGKGKKTR